MIKLTLLLVVSICVLEFQFICGNKLNARWIHGSQPNQPDIPTKSPPLPFVPRPIPPDAYKAQPSWTVKKKVISPDFNKLFPPYVEKFQKPIRQIFDDNRWREFALKLIPNRRPVYPPVYQPPTDIPPNPFATEVPYYSEPTLKPAPHKLQYTEPTTTTRPHYTEPPTQKPHYTEPPTQKPHYTEPPTQRPHYTEPPTQMPHYTEPPTQRPHYTEPPTQRPHYTEPPTKRPHYSEPTTKSSLYPGLPENPLTGIDTFLPVSSPNLHQIIQALTLNRFIHVIDEAGLSDYLKGTGQVTIFVPSNEAFERLPLDVLKQMVQDKEFLKKVLEYHIVSGAAHKIENLGNSYLQLQTISGQKLNVNSHGQVISVNGILVLKPDLPASNGIFHIISDVLYPPVTGNIWQNLQIEKFSILVDILKSSETLTNYLKSGGPYTFFAPSNYAFNKLEPSTLKWIKANPGLFAESLQSLITKGMYYSHHLLEGNSYASLSEGDSIDIGVNGDVKTVNGKPIVVSDLSAVNGVIHVVEELPFEFTLKNLFETLENNGDAVSLFVDALKKAGLVEYLEGEFTIFVPSTLAFEKLDKATLAWLWENPTKLKSLLLNQFVKGIYYSKDLENGLSLTSVSGENLKITKDHTSTKVNGNDIVLADDVASNGVIHVVDGVFFDFLLQNLLETLQNQGKHTIFLQLLNTAGLVDDHLKAGGPYTVFAPNDEYLSEVDGSIIQWLLNNPTELREFLLGHFVSGSYYSDIFTNGYELTALNKLVLKITKIDGVLAVNNKQVYDTGIQGTNGVIYTIDGLLFDLSFGNLLETLQSHGDKYQIFLEALKISGLIDEHLTDGGPFTVFVPSTLAFGKLDKATLAWLWKNPKKLKSLLLNQFVKGIYHFKNLENGLSLTSISGESLKITKDHQSTKVNGNDIILPDIAASNGVIHVVDGVFFDFSLQNLLETLQNQGKHTIFLKLLNAAGLVDDHLKAGGPYTVFAPNDEHLSKVDGSIIQWLLKNPIELREFLLGHFVSGSYYSDVFADGYELTALNNVVLKITKINGVLAVNNKQIYETDVQATNGVINTIDGLLFDVTFGNLLETLQGQGDKYKIFLEALENSGLIDEHLTDGGPFTIFVPTEAAFKKIDAATLHWLLWDPENLRALVLKHFVKGVYYSDDLKAGTSLKAVGRGAQLNIEANGEYKTVNGSPISHFDLIAKNGVIHAIDDVLFSKALKKPN